MSDTTDLSTGVADIEIDVDKIEITWDQMVENSHPESFWLIILDTVYNFTPLFKSNDILNKKQKDAILAHFKQIKNINDISQLICTNNLFKDIKNIQNALETKSLKKGSIQSIKPTNSQKTQILRNYAASNLMLQQDIKKNNYIILEGYVYDLKETFNLHPNGQNLYNKYAGKDATFAFNAHNHPKQSILMKEQFLVGKVADELEAQMILEERQKKKQKICDSCIIF